MSELEGVAKFVGLSLYDEGSGKFLKCSEILINYVGDKDPIYRF